MKRTTGLVDWTLILTTVVLGPLALAQAQDESSQLRRDVEFLAADALGGRFTGSDGENQAADYVARRLESLGVEPLPGRKNLIWAFEFKAGLGDAGSSVELTIEAADEPLRWKGLEHVQALSFSESGKVSGPLVFAGYGLTVPETADMPYDSYAGLDVKDKIVLILRYVPEDLEPDARAKLARYSGLRYKALYAREKGAKAVLVVTGPRSPNAGETVPMTFDAALSGSGILAASVSGDLGQRILAAVAKSLEDVQAELDTGNPHISGFEVPGVQLTLDVRVKRDSLAGHNVIGVLPAKASASEQQTDNADYVLIGAHLDHLGTGNHGNSLARENEKGVVHHGADDNASGVAAVMRVAEMLAQRPVQKPVAIALWSGEEIGLLGSADFVKRQPIPLDRLSAYLNFDMVGRMQENRLVVKSVGSSSVWPKLLERANVAAGFDIRINNDPYVPSDAMSLYLAGVPVLDFFTGAHEDYHRPSDRPERINYEDLERVARFAAQLTGKVAALEEKPDYLEVERTAPTGARASLRAFTGTIPDYATEVDGLRLSGVVGGGPADQAGLREGDIIIEFGGTRVTNIYDYTYALERAEVDEPVTVIFMRGEERMEVTITPTVRK